MPVNQVQTSIIYDGMDRTIVRVIGYYNAATNSNNIIVQANTLQYANSSRPCYISIVEQQHLVDFNDGYAVLQWVSVANQNTDFSIIGGQSTGHLGVYQQNPLPTANLNGLSGDIGLQIQGAKNLDSFVMILTLNKEGGAQGGYANGYIAYNDSDFGKANSTI